MQSVPLDVGKFPAKEALNFTHRSTKLAVLISVAQLATSYFNVAAL
jgi:hypothetical protein